ncbi:MAG: indolepyruvate oxidoreductase subunit beta [Candidatus Thorarchaeota archaeon]
MSSIPKIQLPANRPFNLIVAGVGGQGILLAARLIAKAAFLDGLIVSIGETFGASRRGGTVLSHIRFTITHQEKSVSRKIPLTGSLVPCSMADVLVGLEPLETLRAAPYLNPQSVVLLNTQFQPPIDVIANKAKTITFSTIQSRLSNLVAKLWSINALQLAKAAGEIRTVNTIMVGALAGLQITPISQSAFKLAISDQFENETVQKMNVKAYHFGLNYVTKNT